MSFFPSLSIISEPRGRPHLYHAGLEVGQVCPLRDVTVLSIAFQYNNVKVITCEVHECMSVDSEEKWKILEH